MARLKPGPAATPKRLVANVRLPARCTLLMVTARWTEALAAHWEQAWPGRKLVWLSLDGTSGDGDGRQVYPLFPGWREDAILRGAVLGSAEGETLT